MAIIRLPQQLALSLVRHLDEHPERFAFCFASWSPTSDGPAWRVRELRLIQDEAVVAAPGGWELDPELLVDVVNHAVRTNTALIESHSHGGGAPRFSPTDRRGLADLVPYMLSSLPGRPYAAAVWGDGLAWVEYWLGDEHRRIRSVLVADGPQLNQLVSRDDDEARSLSHVRQEPWFAARGQRALQRMRVAICGLGGLGSIIAQQLVYLGCRDFVLIEFDHADGTSMNRLVTASQADLDTHKGVLARRMIRAVSADARVALLDDHVQSAAALAGLREVDLVIGAVDNDGARLILNEFTRAYDLPYFDAAVGITVEQHRVTEAGARIVLMRPGDPCLLCYGEIDLAEARLALASPRERELARARGYVTGLDVPAPAVISLNAAAAAALVNELSVWVSGLRPPVLYQDLDLLGRGRAIPGQWLTPRTPDQRREGCVHCALAGHGEGAGVDRYAITARS